MIQIPHSNDRCDSFFNKLKIHRQAKMCIAEVEFKCIFPDFVRDRRLICLSNFAGSLKSSTLTMQQVTEWERDIHSGWLIIICMNEYRSVCHSLDRLFYVGYLKPLQNTRFSINNSNTATNQIGRLIDLCSNVPKCPK